MNPMDSMVNSQKVSLSIPTKNRSGFLGRLLYFLADQKFMGCILIGDSSDDFHFQETKKNIVALQGLLNVRHERCLNMSDSQAFQHLCQYIDTPYSGVICDDDFLCVKGLNKCIEFLDNNPEFGAAHGIGVMIALDQSGPYGDIIAVKPYPPYSLSSLTEETGEARLRFLFRENPGIIFCVHRSETWKAINSRFHLMRGTRQGFIFGELVVSSLSVIRNKIKALDCLYLIRQTHDALYSQTPFFEWVTDAEWLPAYQALRERVVHELVAQDRLSEDEAAKIFYEVFHQYLHQFCQSTQFKQSINNHLTFKIKTLLKNVVRSFPGVRALNRRRKVHDMQSSLVSPNHFLNPYFDSFKPIMDIITNHHATAA